MSSIQFKNIVASYYLLSLITISKSVLTVQAPINYNLFCSCKHQCLLFDDPIIKSHVRLVIRCKKID